VKTLTTLLLALLPGCSGALVSIRVDAPKDATVTLAAGVGTPKRVFTAPFVGEFEPGGRKVEDGFPLVFDLDAAAAAAYGADHPVRIYSRLSIGRPTALTIGQKLRITPSEERLRALIRGEVTEISAHAEDPTGQVPRPLATLVMRMVAF
jgi:hypothetical protein